MTDLELASRAWGLKPVSRKTLKKKKSVDRDGALVPVGEVVVVACSTDMERGEDGTVRVRVLITHVGYQIVWWV